MKNEGFYKKLDSQIKSTVKDMDFTVLREQHKDIIELVGDCPLTCSDLIETMQAGDCFCLALSVGRSQAAIADPTKLVIKSIIPTFMGGDSFLDSAIFNIN